MKRRLFLIRHADAAEGRDDAVRPLSHKGEETVRRVAFALRASGEFKADRIWHSPLLRARQTARLLAEGVALDLASLEAVRGMLPSDDPRWLAAAVDKGRKRLALVGHEPHLGLLAGLLVFGEAIPEAFKLRKGAVLCLDREDAPAKDRRGVQRWRVRWLLDPELLAGGAMPWRVPARRSDD